MSANDEDIDKKIADLVIKASEKKIIRKQPKLVKPVDITQMPDVRNKVLQMKQDGFTSDQIATALGYEEGKITYLLDERPEIGTPEQILQDGLRTLVELVPLAEATYRTNPSFHNSLALTGIIDSTKGIISDLYQLKDKEEIYRVIVTKVVQPIIRGMISDMMTEFQSLGKSMETNPDKFAENMQNTAIGIGKKFEESYRRSTDLLAGIVGLTADAKARALAAIALSGD